MRVRGNIHLLRGVLASNVFLLDGGRGSRFLVDTGHFAELPALLLELRRRGIGPRDLTGVLLTHRHSDHAGNARFFAKNGVAIYAAGRVTHAGGKSAPHIARWDGTAWWDVGGGLEDVVQALSVFDDGSGPALYAAGGFSDAAGVPAADRARGDGHQG